MTFPSARPSPQCPFVVPESSIEIVRPFDGRAITTVLFDFDGTLSLERDGWPNLMVAANASALAQAVPAISPAEAVAWVIADIESTIGIPTYMQMKRLCAEIERRGGKAASPSRYKEIYGIALAAMVASVHRDFESGRLQRENLLVPGALRMLELLAQWNLPGGMHLASGTDIAAILASVRLLGLEPFFAGHILAAGSGDNPEQCAKQAVVEKLVSQARLKPGELLCFGDGVPEIARTNEAGGITVGLLTPDRSHYEAQGHFTVAQKRRRLMEAGVHILVPDFTDAPMLLNLLRSYMPFGPCG